VSEDRYICVNEKIKSQSTVVLSSFVIILILVTPILIYAIPNLAPANASNNTTAANAISISEDGKNYTIVLSAIPNASSNNTTAANASSNNTTAANASSNNTKTPQTINQTKAAQDTTVINSIFGSNLPIVFIVVIFLALIIPLVFDMYLAYKRRPESSRSPRVTGMPGLYRSLMAFGIIILLGTVIFYLLALITLNLDEANDVISSLVDLLANLGTILGTALATIIAFYFGIRGTESAVEKAAATVTGRLDRMPPNVLGMAPANGDVPVDSLVQVTFSEPINGSTINESTFAVKSSKDDRTITGKFTLSPDGKTASFDPDGDFSPSTKYAVTVTNGVRDLAGNALAAPVSWSFSTGSGPKGAGTQEHIEQKAATDKGEGDTGVLPPPKEQKAATDKGEGDTGVLPPPP
jgi:hypothetical protein